MTKTDKEIDRSFELLQDELNRLGRAIDGDEATITRLEAENARLKEELEDAKTGSISWMRIAENIKARAVAAEVKLAEAVKILKSVLADGHGYGEIHILLASLKDQTSGDTP